MPLVKPLPGDHDGSEPLERQHGHYRGKRRHRCWKKPPGCQRPATEQAHTSTRPGGNPVSAIAMFYTRVTLSILSATLLTSACATPPLPESSTAPVAATQNTLSPDAMARLAAVLDGQPDRVKARYAHRHPQETLEFFGIEPGMTVIEALPGAGWYSKILLPYLGEKGQLIGADYALAMWAKFDFTTPASLEKRNTWPGDWTARAEKWRQPGDAQVAAFQLGSLPEELVANVDAVLLVRALHNMARFENEGGFLSTAIQQAYRALKPGGIAGVVQHCARDDMPDDWARGLNGYLKRDFVIDQMERAGFELVGESDINANAKDQPTVDDFVWRLSPSLETSRNDRTLRTRLKSIGESNRMTLKFRKPNS